MAQDGARQRRWAPRIGVIVLVVGVIGAVALWLLAGNRYDDAVDDLAPAPVGCDTTLQFERGGTYTFFVETTGAVGDLDGDCEADDRSYELDSDELPRVQLTLVGPGGDEVDLDRADGPSYDRGGSSGSGVRSVDIDDAGEYVLTVEAEEEDVVVRVGRDPGSGVGPMRVAAAALLVAAVVIGALALLLGRGRGPEPVGAPGPGQWPTLPAQPPIAPPVAPGPQPLYGVPPPPGQGASGPIGRPLPPPPPPPSMRPPGQG